jgi:hypothetical protein
MNWLWLCVLISVLCSWFSFACSFQGIPKLASLILSLSRGSGFPFLLIKNKNCNCWSWNMCIHILYVCVRLEHSWNSEDIVWDDIATCTTVLARCVGSQSSCSLPSLQWWCFSTRTRWVQRETLQEKNLSQLCSNFISMFSFWLIDWLSFSFSFSLSSYYIIYRYMLIELVCCWVFVVWYLMFGGEFR